MVVVIAAKQCFRNSNSRVQPKFALQPVSPPIVRLTSSSSFVIPMAPKRLPITKAIPGGVESQRSRPASQRVSTRAVPASQRGAPASQRGGASKKKTSPGSPPAESTRKATGKLEVVPELVSMADLQPIEEMIAPTQVVLDQLRAQAEAENKVIGALTTVLEAKKQDDGVGAAKAAEADFTAAAETLAVMPRAKAMQIWHKLADERLVEMASSLAGALLNDAKLDELFKTLDLDGNGVLDENELHTALNSVAKKEWTKEQVALVFRATDEDNSGGVDFQEVCASCR